MSISFNNKIKTLQFLVPGCQWFAIGENLTWLDEQPMPTEQEIIEAYNYITSSEYEINQWRETIDCSRLQAMLALEEVGILDQIENWINTDAPKVVKLAWKEAYRFSCKSSLFNDFKDLFNLTDEDIDNLFKLALTKEI